VPTENFQKQGVSTIIWANHNMRASVKAVQVTQHNATEKRYLQQVF
jgi:phosphoenolpyruvate phosphomutase